MWSQAEGETEVLVAGDPERKHLEKIKHLGGIPYHHTFISALVSCVMELAKDHCGFFKTEHGTTKNPLP